MRAELAAPGGSLSGVERARASAVDLDEESSAWLDRLGAGAVRGRRLSVTCMRVNLTAAGVDAAGRYPGVAAHLAACGPCSQDFAGLLLAVTNGGG